MDPAALRQAVAADIGEGVRPVAIVATLGTTSMGSVDPVNDLADIAAEHDTWLHVDAAYAGPAAIVPELRHHFVGWERADSIVINPHKWLFTPIDCSVLYCRRPEQLRKAFSLTPEYLKTEEHETATNLMDYGLALGRRLRALKLWFVLRYFGSEGIADRLREHCRLAAGFASRVEREAGWRVVAPVPFSMVAFRFCPTDDDGATDAADRINLAILERVNASGEVFMSHTRMNDRIVLRLCVGNLRTKEAHVDRAWELLREAATTVV
jgi:aromatic-L-amino-acid decarboxylase